MRGARILVVDDDPAIVRSVRRSLEGHGYVVSDLVSGEAVAAAVAAQHPEVVLLDLILPGIDGIEVCRRLRKSSDVPIIVVSAVGDDARKVEALDEGADDYLTKPFSMEELLARIRVALRRGAGQSIAPVLEAGEVRLDIAAHTVTVCGEPLHLTPKEFELLRFLLQNQGRVVTQRQLLAQVWGPEYVEDAHILRTFVHQVRTKLASADPLAGRLIVTDPGVGYRVETQGSRPLG